MLHLAPSKDIFAEMCRWFFSKTSFTSWVNITIFKGCSFNIPTCHLYINSSCWYLLPYHLTWLRNQVQWGLIGRRCGVFGWFSYLVCWDWFGKNDSFMSLKCLNVFFLRHKVLHIVWMSWNMLNFSDVLNASSESGESMGIPISSDSGLLPKLGWFRNPFLRAIFPGHTWIGDTHLDWPLKKVI